MARKARVCAKTLHRCHDGPWTGHVLALTGSAGNSTGWLQIGTLRGRYVSGCWEAMQ